MHIWLFSTLFLPFCCYATGDAQYECGSHGRFEYCIDGIPGCVIGCHCHPGYYFDTDSKICEPNIKLTQDYRRHYLSEPTRIQVPSVPLTDSGLTSTTNPVDDKIDEITKDASDLGDWLYNQFFKTIENQVINNTDENDKLITRRSGSVHLKNKPERKNRKKSRKSGKKKKSKKSEWKKKLLRITEDDSLFDSSSTSSSDETSSSSSESRESSKDHGHKKFIVYNKKPKPPLPSFIFLPNMDTPFYPPIGIPPPPALPMYPMVPVPPMGPMFPYATGTTPNCDNSNDKSINKVTTANDDISSSTSKSQSSATTKRKTVDTITDTTTVMIPETTTAHAQDSQSQEESAARSKHKKYPGAHSTNGKRLKGRNRDPQVKLLQTIKEKLKKRNKIAPIDQMINTQNVEDSFLNNNYLQNSERLLNTQTENFEEDTPFEDVDFKYIAELIHRANDTKGPLKLPSGDVFLGIPRPTSRRNSYYNLDNIPQSNSMRSITDHRHMRRPQESDDYYYTNLGRQIASMIRKIDTQGERQLNIEIERPKTPVTTSQPFFDENIYASRSYWDRLIRSTGKRYYPMYLKETGYFKDSNENLINVENKVKFAVSTKLPLSLPELENIINEMKHNPHNQTKSPNKKLTEKVTSTPFGYRLFRKPIYTQKRNDIIINNIVNIPKNPDDVANNKNIQVKFFNDLINDLVNMALPSGDNTRSNMNISKTLNITPTRRLFNDSSLKIPLLNHLQFLKPMDNVPVKPSARKQNTPLQLNPIIFHHKNLNYYSSYNNPNLLQKSKYPIYFLNNTRKLYQTPNKPTKPSYFHHELHHFDYFDK